RVTATRPACVLRLILRGIGHPALLIYSGLRTSLLGPFLFVSAPSRSDVTNDAVDPLAIPRSRPIASRTNRLAVTKYGVDVTRLTSCAVDQPSRSRKRLAGGPSWRTPTGEPRTARGGHPYRARPAHLNRRGLSVRFAKPCQEFAF